MGAETGKRRIKPVLIAAAVLLAGGLVVCNVPWPVQKTCRAVEIRMDDASYLVEREVRFAGRYDVNLFSADTFSGTIAVSGYPVTRERTTAVAVRARDDVFLYYGHGADAVPFGLLAAGPGLQRAAICVFDEWRGDKDVSAGWSTMDGCAVVCGAADRDEALARLRKCHLIS